MGFVTAGLGQGGNLITVGLGLTTLIIVPVGPNPIKDSTAGAYVYNKKRVKGITVKNDSGTIILQTIIAKSEIPLKLFQMLKINEEDQSRIRQEITNAFEDKTSLRAIIIRKSSVSTTIKQHFITKLANPLTIASEKFINFIEKKTKIIENKTNLSDKKTKHINPVDVLKEVEVTELLDIIKDLEDSDV